MSLLQNSNAISAAGGYDITDSLRFRSSASAYLTRTPTTAGNRRVYTFSAWVKTASDGTFMYAKNGNYGTKIAFSANQFRVFEWQASVVVYWDVKTNAVYRDPSAWYHLVVAVDTTQATASNRVKLYVNGELVTSLATATYPSQNYDGTMNTTVDHFLGKQSTTVYGEQSFVDGYMTEVNFVDGQALTPSDFGEYNTDGVWSPKEYTGTYGTNGFYLNFADKTDFKSFELDGTGDYISAPASEYSNYINGSGDFTIEWWVNYDALPSDGGWYAQDSGSAVVSPFNLFQQTNSWRLYATTANGAWNVFSNTLLATTSLTTNRWYHIACVRNGTTLTLYVDGVSQGTASIGTASLWTDTSHNLSLFNDWQSAGGGGGIDGTISNYRLVKGTAVYTSNFTPPTANLENISGTTILLARSTSTADLSGNITTTANGNLSLVDHLPPISSAIGDDVSGNDNHFATNNFDLTSTATTYDLMSDTPSLADEDTANFATWNPLTAGGLVTFTEANLKASSTSASAPYNIESTVKIPSTGKWYAEVNVLRGASNPGVGIGNNPATSNSNLDQWANYRTNGTYSTGNMGASSSGTPSTYTTGDVIGVAYDADAGTLSFYKNGVAQTGGYTGITSGNYSFIVRKDSASGDGGYLNCGQRPFAYTPPTGYKKLNTFNLPDSSIKDGSQYFNTVTWTGNATARSITGLGFSPDLVWIKNRGTAYGHVLQDTIRGTSVYLASNSTAADTAASLITSFDSDGFSLSTSNVVNQASTGIVGWSWRGSDSTAVSNTDGTITSTVSANTTSGFSVVTYTGNGVLATVGHGLGSTPKVIISKCRSSGTGSDGWVTYHASLGNTGGLVLNLTNSFITDNGWFNSTSPTSSVFTRGTSSSLNASGQTYVAYCFADVEGFSKFGSYTGNGSTDGPFVYTGFRPAFVMVKRSDTIGNWTIRDTSRRSYNTNVLGLFPNASYAEDSTAGRNVDMLSNGFKIRGTDSDLNTSGGTYIYMAFAENPFKNSLGR